MNKLGTIEPRSNTTLVRLIYKELVWIRNIFRQVLGAALFRVKVFLSFKKVAIVSYLNLVVLPQGVLGYLIAFVRPPWG